MDYYQVLNIDTSATRDEIKHAYRLLAKKYHPDISKDPEAHEHFIQITEAYESLMSYSNVHDETTSYSWDDYNSEEELRRKRAREYARMKYREFVKNNEAFRKSWYYWPVRISIYCLVIFCYSMMPVFFLAGLSILFMPTKAETKLLGIFGLCLTFLFFMTARSIKKKPIPTSKRWSKEKNNLNL